MQPGTSAVAKGWWVYLVDAPDDVASQITNCFAFDYCSPAAADSDRWKEPGSGFSVSPDDLLRYDAPITNTQNQLVSGLFGRRERAIYRGKRFRPVARWVQTTTTRTVSGKVELDATGTPAAFASVFVVGSPDIQATTDDMGQFSLSGVPDGNIQLHAQAQLNGSLLEADACYKPDTQLPSALRKYDCMHFDAQSAPLDSVLYTSITIQLQGPDPSFRKITVEGSASVEDCDCDGYDTSFDTNTRSIHVTCDVNPLQLTSSFTVKQEQLCADEVGGRLEGLCVLDPVTNAVTVSAELILLEDLSASCGAKSRVQAVTIPTVVVPAGQTVETEFVQVTDRDTCIAPFPPVPFECANAGSVSALTVSNGAGD